MTDQSVLLSLQEMTEDLGAEQAYRPTGGEEASALIEAVLLAGGRPALLLPDEWQSAAWRLLDHLSTDPDTAQGAATVLADPPQGDQLGIETAATDLVVLAALVPWLQTKISIREKRKDGAWEFDFLVQKQAAPPEVITRLAATLTKILGGPDRPS